MSIATTKYIEQEAAIRAIESVPNGNWKSTRYAKELKAIPTVDVVPVVRCKDCVHSNKWYADRGICYLWDEDDGNAVFEDGFCNYGLKREE